MVFKVFSTNLSKFRARMDELRAMSNFAAHAAKDGVEGLKWHPSDRNQLATCSFDRALKVREFRSVVVTNYHRIV